MKTIMVMHKDPDTRMSIEKVLEKNGYKVIGIDSTDDFFEEIRKNRKFDLILINGLEPRQKIIREVKKKKTNFGYIISSDMESEELAMYKNVVNFVDEPFDIDEFLEKIKRMIFS